MPKLPEQHQPTPEEIKKGKEVMTREQKERKYERQYEAIKKSVNRAIKKSADEIRRAMIKDAGWEELPLGLIKAVLENINTVSGKLYISIQTRRVGEIEDVSKRPCLVRFWDKETLPDEYGHFDSNIHKLAAIETLNKREATRHIENWKNWRVVTHWEPPALAARMGRYRKFKDYDPELYILEKIKKET